jgi:PAS domain S-box-containing protein
MSGTFAMPEVDTTGLPRAEREVLDTTYRALLRCRVGLDDEALHAIKVALRAVVPFDRIAIFVMDERKGYFCVLWRDGALASAPAVFGTGLLVPRDSDTARRARMIADSPLAPEVNENVSPNGSLTDQRLYASGVRSYCTVPLIDDGGAPSGHLALAHDAPGAPSKAFLPLLSRLAKILGPALGRARLIAHGQLFAALVEASPDGMLALDATGTIIEANGAALQLVGRAREEILGQTLVDTLGPSAGAKVREALDSARDPSMVAIDIDVNGARVPLDVVVARVRGLTEASFQVHLRDARGRQAAEEATARRVEHLAFLRGLAEAMAGDLRVETALERAASFCMRRSDIGGVMVFRASSDGALSLVASRGAGDRLEGLLGKVTHADLEKMLGARAKEVKRVNGVLETVGASLDPMTTGQPPRWKVLVPLAHARRPLGAILVLGKPGEALTDSERELWESVGTTVSAPLHAADDFEHVVALEAEKRQLVDNLPVIVARLDPKTGATLFVNGAISRILGFGASEVLGTPGMDALFADPIEWEASAIVRDRAARGMESTWQDRRYRHKDGRLLWLRESVYPVMDATGAVRTIEVIAYDVTTELESRKQLMQSDRLASLGSLAAGIAHEINNPIAFIQLAAGQLTKAVDTLASGRDDAAPERARELIREVGEAAGRIGNIVGELKLFTRIPEGAHSTPVDVNRIVQMAVTLTSAELRRRARVEVSLGDLPLVPGEFASLGQAFVNLLINAAQAIDAKGDAKEPNFVRVSTFVAEGKIIVRVSDTGVGIEPRLLPRIFDPFFKTKAGGEGAGLGLAIAHNLVRKVGGDIRVTSEPGEGSTFEVGLPQDISPELAARMTPSGMMRTALPIATPPASTAITRGRVLVIDDEQALAKALARQLSVRYDVDTVSTASDALAELSVHAYDVVVCDLRMPDQSGPAIYDAIVARSPRQAARFIFTTGGSYGDDDDEIHARARSTGRPILEKPFDGASFEALVADVAEDAT